MSTSEHDIEQRQKRLEALAAQGDLAAVREEAGQLHPSDLADLVELLDEAQQIELAKHYDPKWFDALGWI